MADSPTGFWYAKILADIALGNDCVDHFETVTEVIRRLNFSIDNKKILNLQCSGMVHVCYQ